MSGTPAHDWLAPRLAALITEAEAHGIDRDTALAVLLDLLETGAPASGAAPAPGKGG